MPRTMRVLGTTGIYHIMLRGNERKNIFLGNEEKQRFLKSIAIKQKDIDFSVYCYCVMDNHVHILLDTKGNDLSVIMKAIAVRYASFYNAKHQRVGHVFQDRFKSEAIEDERYLMAVIRYIHNNPVKAGIVFKVEDYPWSSYSCYIKPKPGKDDLVDTEFVLGIISQDIKMAIEEFIKFSHEKDDTEFSDFPDEREIRTLADGRAYLENYLKEKWVGRSWEDVLIHNQKEIIEHFRSHTQLSVRTIAELFGVNRNVVQRIRVESKEPSP